MHVSDLPDKTQDYLKKIYDFREWGNEGITLSQLAETMGQRASTTSEAVKKLHAKGLVEHRPYADIQLTPQGRHLAIAMVRRHRLIETYLCQELGYPLGDVHGEAEILEHAVSDEFIRRIEEKMGFPARDPHGDPIPDASGKFSAPDVVSLSSINAHESCVVDRVSDRDGDLLRYLEQRGILPGVEIEMLQRAFADLAEIRISATGERVQLPEVSLAAVLVSKEGTVNKDGASGS